MNKFTTATLVLLSAVLFSCNNDGNDPVDPTPVKVYDTIRPNAYLPYYPNSWWQYQVNDTGLATSKTSEDYQLVTINDGVYWRLDTVMLPIYEDLNLPVYGYYYIGRNPVTGFYEKFCIFSEKVGDGYLFNHLCDFRWDYGCWYQKTTGKFKSGEDSVITTEVHFSAYEGNYIDKIKVFITYIKDVGISEYYKIDTTSQDTLYKKVLIDYFIDKK
ncbi:MAG: hypothetical protein K9I34_03045 [Bacteroidales bacterium]|nr:hypothetical protein [Bacteroidales bacterium]